MSEINIQSLHNPDLNKICEINKKSYSNFIDIYNSYTIKHKQLRINICELVLFNKINNSTDFEIIQKYGLINHSEEILMTETARILDVGCANGDMLDIISNHFCFKNSLGIDFSPNMIENALSKYSLHLNTMCIDFRDFKPIDPYDVVFAQAFIHLFPKNHLKNILIKLLSLTKKKLFVCTTAEKSSDEGLLAKTTDPNLRYRTRYTREEFSDIMHSIVVEFNNLNTNELSYTCYNIRDVNGKNWICYLIKKNNWKEIYEQDGFIHLRGIISEKEQKYLEEYIMESTKQKPCDKNILRYKDFELSKKLNYDVLDRIENIMILSPPKIKNILDKCEKILEDVTSFKPVIFKDKINFKYPGKEPFPPHQDALAGWYRYSPVHSTIYISIDDAKKENGALEFVRSSHKSGLLAKEGDILDEDVTRKLKWEIIETLMGDIIIFDSHVPHRSGPNLSLLTRRILLITYIPEKFYDKIKINNYIASKRLNQPTIDDDVNPADMIKDKYGKYIKIK